MITQNNELNNRATNHCAIARCLTCCSNYNSRSCKGAARAQQDSSKGAARKRLGNGKGVARERQGSDKGAAREQFSCCSINIAKELS